ncbi:MAG: helix-turn-helix domain-containing protein [Bacillota bacterium]
MLDMIHIGNTLKNLRKDAGLSQDELAQKLYVSHQAVSRWEQGKSLPQLETLLALKEVYNVSLETLLVMHAPLDQDIDTLLTAHSRLFVIQTIIQGNHTLRYYDIIHKLTDDERFYALSEILKKKLPCNFDSLWPRLSYAERRMIIRHHLELNYPEKLAHLSYLMTQTEKNLLKEGPKL